MQTIKGLLSDKWLCSVARGVEVRPLEDRPVEVLDKATANEVVEVF
jgi:hypothetical protein